MSQLPDLGPLTEAERESLTQQAWDEARGEARDLRDRPLSVALHTLATLKTYWKSLTRSSEWRAKKFQEIDRRLAELESRQLSYEGTWREDREYGKGHMVTHAGGIWHCEQVCKGDLPGRSNSWRLAVKGGGK